MPAPDHAGDARDDGVRHVLLRAVPEEARTVVVVGRGARQIGDRLKRGRDDRVVHSVEHVHHGSPPRQGSLDDVVECDVEQEDLPFEAGSVDCILYHDVLVEMRDPRSLLLRHRTLLKPEGCILCSIPNVQHHNVVSQLIRGDFQYQDAGIRDWAHLRFFTVATALKMLLDAGFAPDLVDGIRSPGGEQFVESGAGLLGALRVDPVRAAGYLDMTQMIVLGRPLPDVEPGEEIALSFVACVNDEAQLADNLLRSPCLRGAHSHEVLLFRGCESAAEGLNAGIEQAQHDLVVLVHQDVYLPEGWTARIVQQWKAACGDGAPPGVAGVWGIDSAAGGGEGFGIVVDRDHLLHHGILPRRVDVLDEVCLVVPKTTPLRFDAALQWHLYGADLCLAAQARGLDVVALDAVCHHNSLTASLDPAYDRSADVIARKWAHRLPVRTTCSVIDGPTDVHRPAEPEGAVATVEEKAEDDAARIAVLEEESRVAQLQCQELAGRLASKEASPFWKARRLYAAARSLGRRR